MSASPRPASGARGPAGGRPEVAVVDEQDDHPVDHRRALALARHVLAEEGVRGACELNVVFATEAVIAELNERFMGVSGPTDVLAFPIDDEVEALGRRGEDTVPRPDPPPPDLDDVPVLLGDVVICPAVAARNAPEHAGTYEAEIDLLLVHGILHVLGMDHADADEAAVMQARERTLLEGFGGAP